jgi:hypothetical protein
MVSVFDARPRAFGMVAALCLALLSAGHYKANAQLQLTVTEGSTTYVIIDEGPLDTQFGANNIQALAGALVFPDFQIVDLSATTNDPGTSALASLSIAGTVHRTTGGAPVTLTITATDVGFTLPAGSRTLVSSTSDNFGPSSSGDSATFTSWFNPTNAPFATDVSSGPLTEVPPTGSGSTAPMPVGSDTPYGLTNETVLTLNRDSAVTFTGSTVVTNRVTSVPEPSGLIVGLVDAPMASLLMRRGRIVRR